MSAHKITFRNVSVEINRKLLLEDLTLTFSSDEVVAIIGHNGSGKTTLLRSLIRAVNYNRGEIIVDAQNLKELSQKSVAGYFSYIPQSLSSGLNLSSRDFLKASISTSLLLEKGWQERVESAAELAGALQFLSRPLGTLSVGERQRVLFAAAIAQNSKIFLCDELSHSLDPKAKSEVIDCVQKIRQDHKVGIVWVTHDIAEAFHICERIVALRAGRILSDLTTKQSTINQIYSSVFGLEQFSYGC